MHGFWTPPLGCRIHPQLSFFLCDAGSVAYPVYKISDESWGLQARKFVCSFCIARALRCPKSQWLACSLLSLGLPSSGLAWAWSSHWAFRFTTADDYDKNSHDYIPHRSQLVAGAGVAFPSLAAALALSPTSSYRSWCVLPDSLFHTLAHWLNLSDKIRLHLPYIANECGWPLSRSSLW